MSAKLEGFISAFISNGGYATNSCACGRVFYDAGDSNIDWEEGQFESLETDENATALERSVRLVSLGDNEYVSECSCWLPIAQVFMENIDHHAYQIARYLTEEKKRKTMEAQVSPVVE